MYSTACKCQQKTIKHLLYISNKIFLYCEGDKTVQRTLTILSTHVLNCNVKVNLTILSNHALNCNVKVNRNSKFQRKWNFALKQNYMNNEHCLKHSPATIAFSPHVTFTEQQKTGWVGVGGKFAFPYVGNMVTFDVRTNWSHLLLMTGLPVVKDFIFYCIVASTHCNI